MKSELTFAEPFTPRGVAAFAQGKLRWLMIAQIVIALLAAGSLTWFLDSNCFSVVSAAIKNLPDTGKISFGKLDWHGDSPKTLAEGKLLALVVDLNHSGQIHSPADVQIEFGKDSMRIYSYLGYSDFYYPPWPAPFNRTDLQPLWGAWVVEILFISGAAFFLGLLLSWAILSLAYFLPVWLAGYFLNRDLNIGASFKLSAAALMPGALLMVAGVLLYNAGFLNLILLSFIFAGHFVIGWFYLALSLIFLPRISSKPKGNPFQPSK